MLSFPR